MSFSKCLSFVVFFLQAQNLSIVTHDKNEEVIAQQKIYLFKEVKDHHVHFMNEVFLIH